jgi:hypothetical protein
VPRLSIYSPKDTITTALPLPRRKTLFPPEKSNAPHLSDLSSIPAGNKTDRRRMYIHTLHFENPECNIINSKENFLPPEKIGVNFFDHAMTHLL